jgi:hypothetical protein
MTAVVSCLFDDGDLETDLISRNDKRDAPEYPTTGVAESWGAVSARQRLSNGVDLAKL